jgi:hypothetical protein
MNRPDKREVTIGSHKISDRSLTYCNWRAHWSLNQLGRRAGELAGARENESP